MTVPWQAVDSTLAARSVDGRVARGTRRDLVPVTHQWVVLHRVGPDRAGPLDSTRTDGAGHYQMRYHASGSPDALYFASTSYGGVTYFTAPLRSTVVRGDDGLITVFDTTSGPVQLALGGRHLIIGAPQANGRRPVGEVYDIKNDSTVTLVARDSLTPSWTAHLPAAAVDFQVNANGELGAGAVLHTGSTVGMLAPISPGIRQVAFTYELPSDAFPLHIPVERTTGVFEILLQEPAATIAGVPMHEGPPVSTDGRVFRRYLGKDVPASSVLTIDVPHLIGPERQKVYLGVGIAVVVAMLAALLFAMRRPRLRGAAVPAARSESEAESLVRRIAELDAAFEGVAIPDDAERAGYEQTRETLKRDLATRLSTSTTAV